MSIQQLNFFGEPDEVTPASAPKPTLYEKTCEHCGTEFYAKRMNTKYCSNDCKKEAAKARQQQQHHTIEAAPPQATNIVHLFANDSPLLETDFDAPLLMQIVENQRLQIENQQRLIELLQSTIEAFTHAQLQRPSVSPPAAMLKNTLPPPLEDDDDLPMIEVKDASSAGESTDNFLNSMFNL